MAFRVLRSSASSGSSRRVVLARAAHAARLGHVTVDSTPAAWPASSAWSARPSMLRLQPASSLARKPLVDSFSRRHIGPDMEERGEMLATIGIFHDGPAATDTTVVLDEFIKQVIPPDVLSSDFGRNLHEGFDPSVTKGWVGSVKSKVAFPKPLKESEVATLGAELAAGNVVLPNLLGRGYHGTLLPEVIKRDMLQNPAWYTSYTPYQPEISQGRLESLLNFQTLVCDLTALPIANASLLDAGTAAAEAMTLSLNALPASRAQRPGKTFLVSETLLFSTLQVVRARAEGFGVAVETVKIPSEQFQRRVEELGDDLVGAMVQYPDELGQVDDLGAVADLVHSKGALVSCATDLLALTLMTPPGEWGVDVAFGSAQRLGVPMGMGGPHAAFFAVAEKHKRRMPGRLVGVSRDRLGGRALRLALQTREQHIRREKATSNVCTSQALLANISAMYAVYHGPDGLRDIAAQVVRKARQLQSIAELLGFATEQNPHHEDGRVVWDTVIVHMPGAARDFVRSAAAARSSPFLAFAIDNDRVSFTVDESTTLQTIQVIQSRLLELASTSKADPKAEADSSADPSAGPPAGSPKKYVAPPKEGIETLIPQGFRRTSSFLTHPVFNSHHSETELMRYMHHLQSKDLSLVHSMIPLGSCTMKLNGATEMSLITLPGFANVHPLAHLVQGRDANKGYLVMLEALSAQLRNITQMDAVSLQPNSGAQGEFAGLRVIRAYHDSRGDTQRDVCLIPVSAHGTNPASAAMAGMRVVPVKCDAKTGNLDMEDLEAKCEQHADRLAAIMVTYPSTFGVFEPGIRRACELVHGHGGQVYMDGANMNAQIGLCSPGHIGADVCHLNLHKTFCIPHGGGGPGAGPICVKSHLQPFLPGRPEPVHYKVEVEEKTEKTQKTQKKQKKHEEGDAAAVEGGSAEFSAESPAASSAQNLPVSSSYYGSASILPISWAYNTLMGFWGLQRATKVAILNANYLLARLAPHYKILYTNEQGRCAHEFILDARPFRESAGVEAIDIAKRLQDYGFHAPTMSWPVANTLMIEPTESESKGELDRFADALISIRREIRDVEEGRQPREGNVLKMAPHPMHDIIDGDGEDGARWDRPYSRQTAAYPLPWLREKKFWPSVARIDDTYGDLNLFCTCPSVEETVDAQDTSPVQTTETK